MITIRGQLEHWLKLGRAVDSAPGFTTARILAALNGRFDPAALEDAERVIYDDLLVDALTNPSEAEVRAYADIGSRPGAVGDDEDGQLVRVLHDGRHEVIEETSSAH